ncbi:MAG: acyltransferase family protein [Paludibacteraceae bacterium]|nr:acyltransferase family protein [Paludibacteraceae bacterium]
MKTTHEMEWMNNLRAIATLGVILIHVSSPVVSMAYGYQMNYWWVGNIIDSVVRFAVPAFLMLSGASLLNKDYELKDFYVKRIKRVLIPFLFWMLAYWVFFWFTDHPEKHPQNDLGSIFNWAIGVFTERGISKHFWFVYMLLFLYAVTPFLGRWIRKQKTKTISYILLGWIFYNLMQTAGVIDTKHLPLLVNKVYGYILYSGYMVLGYYLCKFDISSRKFSTLSYIVLIATILFTAIGTYYISKHAKDLTLKFYGNLGLNTIAQSIAIFILMKKSTVKNKILVWIRNIVSQYSFGIYLVHIMVIGVFYLNDFFWTIAHPALSVPVVAMATLVVSILIIYILRKIPVVKYVSGYK